MKKQNGSSLVIALVLLTIITLVAVYSLEGSNIQSKMVANSLFSTLTYQECRNEQEANIRFYNTDTNRSELITIQQTETDITAGTLRASSTTSKKSDIIIGWRFISSDTGSQGISNNAGNNIDSSSQITAYVFEHDCLATFRFATNSQTLGVKVQSLKVAGKVI